MLHVIVRNQRSFIDVAIPTLLSVHALCPGCRPDSNEVLCCLFSGNAVWACFVHAIVVSVHAPV